MDKKRKAEEKRNRRNERKAESILPQAPSDDEAEEVAQALTDNLPADDD